MRASADPDLVKRLSTFASAASLFSIAIGVSELVAWKLGITHLLTWGLSTPTAPNAAGCTILAGVSLWLLKKENDQARTRVSTLAAKTAAGLVSVAGLLTLAEHIFRLNFGIDRLLLVGPLPPQLADAHILMAPAGAANFLLFGAALLVIDWRTRREGWPAQFLCLGTAMATLFGLLSLLLGPSVTPFTVALPAVASYVLLTSGLICSRATWALGGFLTSRSLGARFLRRALPASVLVLSLIGWFISKALLTDEHFTWVEVSVLAMLTSTLLSAFIGWTAFTVDRSDDERRQLAVAHQLGPELVGRVLDKIEETDSEAALRRRVRVGVAVAVLMTAVMGLLSWRIARQATEDADWVAHTYDVTGTLELTFRHFDDVETGARGFALTGQEQFLEPYESGRSATGKDLERLRLLTMDNPDQQRRLDALIELARARLNEAAILVDSRRSSSRIPPAAYLERGKRVMNAVRATIAEMVAAEKRLLALREQRARETRRFTNFAIGLGSFLGVIFLIIAGAKINQEIRAAARSQAQVRVLNANLERRVEQRTKELEAEATTRRETEVKLRGSEQMFRLLLDGIKDYAVYMLDSEGRVASWNAGAVRIKGYQREEIIGKHVSCFYTATDRERNDPQRSLQEAASTGRFEGEGWRVRKDGSTFWANAVITPLYGADGSLSGYSKVVRDISARKQAEEELKKQANLLDLAHDAILVRDLGDRVIFWNRGAQRMYGWSADEVAGRVTHELLHTVFPSPLPAIEEVVTSKGEWEGELRHRTRTGVEVVVASRWSVQRDSHGTPTAILEINRDITDRKLAEAALGESEGRLAGVIASAMDSIITVDEQQCILLFNRAAEKMFRCVASEALGQPITRFIPRRFHDAHAGHIRKFGELGVTNRAMGPKDVLWALRADGQEFQIEASISQVVTGGKKLFTVILRDVTERVQAQQALVEAQARMSGIVASAMDAIITVNSQQRIVVFNAAATKIFLCSEAEALGQSIERFIPQRFHAAHAAHVREFGQTGSTNRAMGQLGALWAVRADGEEFQIEASISQVEVAGQKMFTVILRDVTERKQAEQVRERLAAVVDSSDDAIISSTPDGTIGAWNRGAEKVFGYSAAEIVGKPLLVLLPPERFNEAADVLAGIRSGESFEHFETVRVRKDGTNIDVSVTISPMRDGNGAVIGASAVARDITGRKRAEQALRDSEENLRLALDGARLGTWQWKLETDELEGSPLSFALFGLPADTKFNFARFGASLHPEDRAHVGEAMRRCLAGEAEYDVEYRTIWPDGTERWIAARGRVYQNAGGKNVDVRGILFDITDRRAAQEALRESEERLLAMANGIPQLAFIAEADGSIYWYNQRWYEFTGTTLEQMQGWGWQSVHHPDFLPKVLAEWTAAIAEGKPFEMEFPLRGADGNFRAFLTRVMALKDSAGRVVRWFGTNTDIEELKRTEERLAVQAEELRHSREALETQTFMLRSVLDSMVEGLVAADQQGNFILWNPAAEKIMGLGPAKLPPSDWSTYYGLFSQDTITPIPPGETPLERTLRGETGSSEIFLRQGGVDRGLWLETNGAPLIDKDGVMRGGVLAFRDITQRKADELEIRKLNENLEERIAKRTEQLEATNRELEAFSYSVSHDLRSPLRHIASFSRILVNDFGPVMPIEAREHLQHIENAVSRMGLLIDALLKMAVLRRRSLQPEHSELNPIVDEVISMLKAEGQGRDVEWRIAKLPALNCDPVLMAQVFQNLIGNALKYSRGRARAVIEVDSIQQPDKPPIIFVRDNGAGFNMKYAERLFGVFQRFHTESEFEGSGVGLATVQRIIQKHGGMIWAEAEPDHGATFYFALQMTEQIGTAAKATVLS
jgi:PAS domain S-box-containing protein